jgi:hypothetical protein
VRLIGDRIAAPRGLPPTRNSIRADGERALGYRIDMLRDATRDTYERALGPMERQGMRITHPGCADPP